MRMRNELNQPRIVSGGGAVDISGAEALGFVTRELVNNAFKLVFETRQNLKSRITGHLGKAVLKHLTL